MSTTETLMVPKTITDAQADMLGMPKEYYERIVARASQWIIGDRHTGCAPVDTDSFYTSLITGTPLVSVGITHLLKSSMIKPSLPKGIEDAPEIRERMQQACRTAPLTNEEKERINDD